MPDQTCVSCRRPKASLHCESCQEPLCKDCKMFLREGTFSFLAKLPEELSHTNYCTACYTTQIEPALQSYEETMELARKAYFFFKTQKRTIPVLRRARFPIQIVDCADRDETILRLAFHAVSDGYNAIIEADVLSEKVRMGVYQTTRWKGTGVAAEADKVKLDRSEHYDE